MKKHAASSEGKDIRERLRIALEWGEEDPVAVKKLAKDALREIEHLEQDLKAIQTMKSEGGR